MSEELITVLSEEIYRSLVDCGYIKLIPAYKDYSKLPQEVKETIEHIAHNLVSVFDDWYEGEGDFDDEDFDDDEPDDDYADHEAYWEL